MVKGTAMSDVLSSPPNDQSLFDAIRHEDEQGEFWSARELMPLLEYNKWQDFHIAIHRAIEDCAKAQRNVPENFTDVRKVSGARGPGQQDYRLTRYACHLIIMTARTSGDRASLARSYFSDKVEEAEFLEWRRRAIASYVARGYSQRWSELRVDGITTRNKLTHEWSVRGIKQKEFAILTDNLHMEMFGLSVQGHMGIKHFPVTYKGKRAVYKGDLREALTDVETVVTSLGETVARALHIKNDSQGFVAINEDVTIAGAIAADTRHRIEAATGQPVVSPRNMIREPDGGLWAMLPAPDDAQ
jgi:hypothetical protein